jgi:hypothetical protein
MQENWEAFVGLSPANASDGGEDADYDDAPALVWLRLVDSSGLSPGYPVTVAPRSTLVIPVTDIPDRPREPFQVDVTTDAVIYPSLSQ